MVSSNGILGAGGIAQGLSSTATAAIWIGVIVLAIAAGAFIALLIAARVRAGSKKPKTVVPGTSAAPPTAGPVASVRPQPAAGPALRPIVPVIVGQEASAPADDGQRDVFASGPAPSGSGSEITTVLPIFAPAEPFDLTAPAIVPDRPSERSLAGVATGPQPRLADHPAPPVSPVGLAGRPLPPARLADRPAPPVPPVGLAGRPAPPVPPVGLAGRAAAPVPPAGPADYPGPLPPLARSADRPPAPRRVSSRPPWELSDPSSAPGGTVSSAPPWAPTEPPAAAPRENASPGPPWGQTEPPPLGRQEGGSPGPPWDRAEHLLPPTGARPDGDNVSQRHSGRHRSRRP